MELIAALRKIRACEGEVAAQLVLEYLIEDRVAAEREACAALLDAEHEKSKHIGNYAAHYARMLRERLNSVV